MATSENNVFRNVFLGKVSKAISDAKHAAGIDHQGLKGAAREMFTADMLVPVLPPEVRLGTGQLVAHDGKTSSQIDVILYAPSIMPPALFNSSTGLFPIEGAVYTVEVKSKLTASNLQEAIANARSVRALNTLMTEHFPLFEGSSHPSRVNANTAYPVTCLFAFDSDLSLDGKTEIARYREWDEQADTDPAIAVICVVGRGYWYSRVGGGWSYMSASDQLDEVMTFLAGTTNTIPQLLAIKGRPKFGMYLQSDETHFQDA
ncbi:DUF6602 domain-containing protein [Devosia sp.]|uniref:DUF6602 domain-containing protein n=1 Tax=Devosia sp. TaxID=1871048 RepID=UPI003A952C4F